MGSAMKSGPPLSAGGASIAGSSQPIRKGQRLHSCKGLAGLESRRSSLVLCRIQPGTLAPAAALCSASGLAPPLLHDTSQFDAKSFRSKWHALKLHHKSHQNSLRVLQTISCHRHVMASANPIMTHKIYSMVANSHHLRCYSQPLRLVANSIDQ